MIKNYTSTVPAEKTILKIEIALINSGAVGIMKDYRGRQVGSHKFLYSLA